MNRAFRNKTAIVGIGMSEIGKSLPCGSGALTVDAIRAAVADAGLQVNDIDGLATYATGTGVDGIERASVEYTTEALGLHSLQWFSEVRGGGPILSPLAAALDAVHSGKANYAVVYKCMYRPKGKPTGAAPLAAAKGLEQFAAPYGYGNILQLASMQVTRWMNRYGLTKEHIGELVLHSHRQAMLNDHAVIKQELTMEDYLAAPYYAEPISKLDCDVPLDGATAFLVTTAERARQLRQQPVYVSAIHNAIGSNPSWGFYAVPEFDQMASYVCCKNIWDSAGIQKEDVNFVQLYDGFSYFPFLLASHLGLCKPEEMGDYIAEACRKGKEAPVAVTTAGGSLCEGRLHGGGHLYEAVLQLRGRAAIRQLPQAKAGIATAGGFNSCGVVVLRNEP